MKKFSVETCLGMLLLAGLLLLATKGVDRMKEFTQNTEETENFVPGEQEGAKEDEVRETEEPQKRYDTGWIVVLDPGHGGSDPGKIGVNNALEKDINLAIGRKLKDCLEEQGVQAILTRENEGGLCKEGDSNQKQADMRARCEIIDKAQANLTVSIHQNSYTAESVCGPQVFYHAQSSEGKLAADYIQQALNDGLSVSRPRETKDNNTYYILKKTKTPVVIAECGFLSNWKEAELLVTEEYQQKVAEALCQGILNYLKASEEESV